MRKPAVAMVTGDAVGGRSSVKLAMLYFALLNGGFDDEMRGRQSIG